MSMTKRTMMRRMYSSPPWFALQTGIKSGVRELFGNIFRKLNKNILIRLDKMTSPCYTETVARACVQAFGTSGRCYRYGLTHTE